MLDVVCSTRNTDITATLMTVTKVTGIDFILKMLEYAKIEANIADIDTI